MRKQLFIFLSFISLVVIAPTVDTLAQGLDSQSALGKLFIQSLQKKQFKLLTKALAPTDVYAVISPEEASNKSEMELKQVQKVVETRLKSKWDILQAEAKFHKVKPKKLQFLEVNQKEIPFQSAYLSGLEVVAGYQQKTLNFLLIIVQIEATFYLLDIAQQSNIFEQ